MTRRWIIRDVDKAAVQALTESCGLAPLVAHTLVARGIQTAAAVEDFLHPSLDREWSAPEAVCGLVAVSDALEEAIRAHRRILVFGDFDVDGISATACMVRGLSALGASVDYLIPNRMDEGYGLTAASLERIYERAPELVVTVDCGISSRDEVAQLCAHGITVLVTDHHEPSGAVPAGVPVANPKMEEGSPQSILAGVGVALKLIALLGARFDRPLLWRDLTDIATLGTLADVMPLTGENRALVAEGLALIERSPRPGIAAALALSKRGDTALTATDLSFSLIPRLNAAGRMGDPASALQLLIDDDPVRSFETAALLDAANTERRAIEGELFAEALAQAQEQIQKQQEQSQQVPGAALPQGRKVIVVAGEGWHEGVRGIVASRLVSHFGVPALVFTLTGDEARGSGRSVGAVNLFRAVERCANLTLRFGGHEAAVGVTVARDALEDFRACLEAALEQEPAENFHPPLLVDAQLDLADLDREAVEQLSLLEPYGQSNREPLYVTCGLTLRSARAVGAKKNHLSFTATDGQRGASGIWFNCPAIEEFVACRDAVDIIYRPRVDEWKGARQLKLAVERIYRADGGTGVHDRFAAVGAVAAVAAVEAARSGVMGGRNDGVSLSPACSGMQQPHECKESNRDARVAWECIVREAPADLTERLASEIIGTSVLLHPAQREALAVLATGESALVVMATGRGKSLIFQTHAARLALNAQRASIFIYPLRALIADQLNHLTAGFSRLDLEVCSLTGENTAQEKDGIFQRLYEGTVDVLLTTPEFFALHVWRFAESSRVGFVVFDEAHHIHTERAAEREGYHDLGARRLRERFPHTQFLAVTATSDDRITAGIRSALGIERVIVDESRRPNLRLHDARNLKERERETLLVSIVERGEKAVIYANSRVQVITLARLLRKRLPATAAATAFYHAGLTRAERRAIEQGLRAGTLTTVISTSAFGEGVDVPDISHVVLYHLPFSAVAFNQMSGRAGRGGEPATVHLLYTALDAALNRRLLAPSTPRRDELATLYRVLRECCVAAAAGGTSSTSGTGTAGTMSSTGSDHSATTFVASTAEIAEAWRRRDPSGALDERGVCTGIAIFEELGLLTKDEDCQPMRITLVAGKRVELFASSRYLEGAEERALFEDFVSWALGAAADELREQITGPLTPSDSLCQQAGEHA
ncbi:MAG: single-stranded-DNA-specific exonuclease RecJ [Coriobacteriales bacterium]|jgi:single-stranded-DNA-specific exonuclease|nr:single-stranded-DNA-specific exonuclease RecJ [Coriobacteriales bacterium]